MRVRVRHEIERRECRDARLDSNLLDAGRHEEGPDDVSELRGREQRRQRQARYRAFGGEAQGKVPDEHRRMIPGLISVTRAVEITPGIFRHYLRSPSDRKST